ncbi:hypothetical protein IDH44_09720 [Paenibacillus sp. IB182496]|uniref:Uncharacterized protein n=1 Tax=Paenibacillus sabuli TaxID=2772509 RepID=A0A927BT82_9BACL|nr:hypothetical protein [Paenibacillus sabuli]MBD2845466.1 hypothetical protein [Paenibacillus sabuli]
MTTHDRLRIGGEALVAAWQERLPELMPPGARAEVLQDGANSQVLRIHIQVPGHQAYTLDYKVSYADSREIRAELVDVDKHGRAVDVEDGPVQELVRDYMRVLHECAQALHSLTHA